MSLTRRDLTKLALGCAVAAQATPAVALFHRRWTPERFTEQLVLDLNKALKPDCDGAFSVARLSGQDVPFWQIEAVIRLDWPPGYRQRPYRAEGDDPGDVYADILAQAHGYYQSVWTYPDGVSCLKDLV